MLNETKETMKNLNITKREAVFFNSKYRGEFANSNLNEAIKLIRDWDSFNCQSVDLTTRQLFEQRNELLEACELYYKTQDVRLVEDYSNEELEAHRAIVLAIKKAKGQWTPT